MIEQPVTFTSSGQQVVGMVHVPSGAGPFPAVMFFHGFTGYSGEKFRLFVYLARKLASMGMLCLRFDFRGHGNSAGSSLDITVEGEWADAEAALRYLRGRPDVDTSRIGVVGMSMGGMVAAHVLGSDPQLKAGVLLCPVGNGYASAWRKGGVEAQALLEEQGYVDLGGWLTSKAFVDQLKGIRTVEELSNTHAPVLFIHGDADEAVPPADSEAYFRALLKAGGTAERLLLPGANHTFESEAWHRSVLDLSADWFERHLLA